MRNITHVGAKQIVWHGRGRPYPQHAGKNVRIRITFAVLYIDRVSRLVQAPLWKALYDWHCSEVITFLLHDPDNLFPSYLPDRPSTSNFTHIVACYFRMLAHVVCNKVHIVHLSNICGAVVAAWQHSPLPGMNLQATSKFHLEMQSDFPIGLVSHHGETFVRMFRKPNPPQQSFPLMLIRQFHGGVQRVLNATGFYFYFI